MRSLWLRLILMLGLAIVVAAAVQFTTSFRAAMEEANKLFDYHMYQIAIALQDSSFDQFETYSLPDPNDNNFDFVIQVWGENGIRVYQSRSYRSLPLQAAPGYSTVTLDNGNWRVYASGTPKRMVQITQKMQARRDRAISLALHSLWPIIPVSLLLFIAAWWAITSALSPINRIGHELSGRKVDSLTPISDADVPKEVALLVAELNSLFTRVAQALHAQQQFVADAAHELRSPLTALKLQVQTLAKAKDETARALAVARLLGGVDRAARLVEQLLTLARHNPSAAPTVLSSVSLLDCLQQTAVDIAPLAAAKNIQLQYAQYDTLQQANITGDEEGLRIMIRNLMDNAVRYTPEYGTIAIDIAASSTAVILTIQDSGPGIAPAERERVFDRFYRVPGTLASGSGLGLAIVQAIADYHQAKVVLSNAALGGLAISIIFPSH